MDSKVAPSPLGEQGDATCRHQNELEHPESREGIEQGVDESGGTINGATHMSLGQILRRQRFLFWRAALISTLACGFAVLFALLQNGIERALLGWSSLELRTEPNEVYRDRMKGLDMALLSLWCLSGYLEGKILVATFFTGKNILRQVLSWHVMVVILFSVLSILFCYIVLNDRQIVVNVPQINTAAFAASTLTNIVVLTIRKGVNHKLPGRILRSLPEAILVWLISMASSFYTVLNRISEVSVLLNVLLMSFGYPLLQFILRVLMERKVRGIYSKNRRKSRAEVELQMGPITLLVEVLLIVPGFVVMLQVDSDISFYTSAIVSLAIEIVELIPIIKFRNSMGTNKSAGVHSFGNYVSNLEQAEKVALFSGIGLNIYIYGLTTELMVRSFFAILVETIADVIKERVCFHYGIKTSKEHIQVSLKCVLMYSSFCAVGIFMSMVGFSYAKYLL